MNELPAKRGTRAEIGRWLELSERTIDGYVRRLGVKADKAGKYPALPFFQEQARREAADNRNKPDYEGGEPPVSNWADVEKRERVKKLRIEIQSLTGQLVAIDEVQTTLGEYCECVNGALNNWVEMVAATKRDPDVLRWAESARDAALRAIQERLEETCANNS